MIDWVLWGIPLILNLQALGSWLTPPMKLFTSLGQEQFYLLVMPAILWCIDVGLGLRLGLILLTSNMLNSILKLAFGLPRPYWIFRRVAALSTESSFGLPSGHAQNAVALWGRMAVAIQRRWALAAAIALMFLISLSRVELGVHFPADVIAGWIVGAIILVGCLRFDSGVSARLSRASPGSRLTVAVVAPLVLVGLALAVRSVRVGIGFPQGWAEAAAAAAPLAAPIDPLGASDILAVGGIFLGFAVGGALLVAWGRFRVEGPWTHRLARFGLGAVGVLVIYLGLEAIFPRGPSLLPTLLRMFRYALVGFWIAYLAPRVFVWAKLS